MFRGCPSFSFASRQAIDHSFNTVRRSSRRSLRSYFSTRSFTPSIIHTRAPIYLLSFKPSRLLYQSFRLHRDHISVLPTFFTTVGTTIHSFTEHHLHSVSLERRVYCHLQPTETVPDTFTEYTNQTLSSATIYTRVHLLLGSLIRKYETSYLPFVVPFCHQPPTHLGTTAVYIPCRPKSRACGHV